MGHSLKSRTADGFTLVEVMIVLAIAGLMLLLILEIIPALERTSRNNSRKQDVSTILEAVSHWELSHSGNVPLSSDNYLQYSTLNFYTNANITIHYDSANNPPSAGPSAMVDKVDIYNYQQCDPNTPGASTATASGYSDVVAIYAIETSNAPSGHCQQLN